MLCVDEFEHAGLNIQIFVDEDAYHLNPFIDYDHIGERYVWGPDRRISHEGFELIRWWDDYDNAGPEIAPGDLVIPLSFHHYYETELCVCDENDANAAWVITAKEMRDEFNDASPAAMMYVEGCCQEYESWARGDVYGYVLKDENDNELYSCWGYIGNWDQTYGCKHEAIASANLHRTLIEKEAVEREYWLHRGVETI